MASAVHPTDRMPRSQKERAVLRVLRSVRAGERTQAAAARRVGRGARPFVPFRLYLTDGAQYDIRHPEFMMIGERFALIGQAGNPAKTVAEGYATVSLYHIVRVEPLELPAASNGN